MQLAIIIGKIIVTMNYISLIQWTDSITHFEPIFCFVFIFVNSQFDVIVVIFSKNNVIKISYR